VRPAVRSTTASARPRSSSRCATWDRATLKHQVIFIWSVREEIGREARRWRPHRLGTTPRRVYAIDTFVSADSPLELPNFAAAPIGAGSGGAGGR